jgi:hypothetical protein
VPQNVALKSRLGVQSHFKGHEFWVLSLVVTRGEIIEDGPSRAGGKTKVESQGGDPV